MTRRAVIPVSVVIPCYRASESIERTLASVRAQTVWPLEVILVDDASGDGTLQLLQTLADLYPQPPMRVISQEQNQGAAMARNAGWSLAVGDYVAFLDADDAWLPEKLNLQYSFMSANTIVAASGHDYRIWGASQDARSLPDGPVQSRIISKLEIALRNPCVTPSVMVRRDIGMRFARDRRYVDDHLLWQEIIFSGLRFVKLNVVLAEVFKPLYGVSGLSSHLWEMQRAELDNYRILRRSGFYSVPVQLVLQAYSLAKFVRRLLIVLARRLLSGAS